MEKQVSGAETTINAPAETVWHAITRSEIALMPGTTVRSNWTVGSPITFEGEFNGKSFKDYGEVVELTDGRLVAFSHWSGQEERPKDYHVVRYELTALEGQTHVRLTQTNIGPNPDIDAETKAQFDRNWQTMLAHLKKASEAGG